MRPTSLLSRASLLLATFFTFLPFTSAIKFIESNSLNPCQTNSSFTASLFNVIFTPNNRTIAFDIVGISSIQGNVTVELQVFAYGLQVLSQSLNPCDMNLDGFCPMTTDPVNINSNFVVSQSVIDELPSIVNVAYEVPDLDGTVRVYINDSDTGESVACVEAQLSNGKTVYQKGVGWATAVIAGLALLASAITSGLGFSNTAAHVAANALSLFGYFQGQAMAGMTAVPLPPIVQSWTQDFQWSMGIIRVGFLQAIATWYQQSTGGTPSTTLSSLSTTSVEVLKRSLSNSKFSTASDYIRASHRAFKRAATEIVSRATTTSSQTTQVTVVRGIKRVGFRAGIESTNIFLTGLIFFMVFIVLVILCVAIFKGICELAVRAKWMKGDKFQDFRNGWLTVLKGILFRLVLIGYPQMCILDMWELTQRDSAAEVVLALFFFIAMSGTLAWASLKVIRIAKRSVAMHKNPAYILYSDPACLNKWGFLYVQFRATAYYFIVPVLGYTIVKAMFIAFGQGSGTAQAIAFVIIELVALVFVCYIRPWMDKRTNTFNISISVVNFLNAILLLIFTNVWNGPGLVAGVCGVVFFILNAAFALVLLILVLISSIMAITSKNPDTRYQQMRDDRASFIKSQTGLTTELDALGATARGDIKGGYKGRDLDDDDDSFSSGSGSRQVDASGVPLPPSTANSARRSPPHSPVDPSVPLFPSEGPGRHAQPTGYSDNPRGLYQGYNDSSRPGSDLPLLNPRTQTMTSARSNYDGYRQQNNASPWQRGAGYDH